MTLQAKPTFSIFLKVLLDKIFRHRIARLFFLMLFIFTIDVDLTNDAGRTALDIQLYSINGILLCVTIILLFLAAARQMFQNMPQFRELITYTFVEQGIIVRGDTFESVIDWRNIQRIDESRDSFILTQPGMNWFIIPKKQMQDSQHELLRDVMIQERMPVINAV